MATLGSTAVTLMDIQRRLDPNSQVATIIELMSKQNEILDDVTFMEGNLPTGHKTTIRTGLPTVQFRSYNEGVAASKSATRQVTEECAMMDAFGQVDKALADLSGNAAAFRLTEDAGQLEAMNQLFSQTLFYGDPTTSPKKFLGLAPRLYAPTTDDTSAGFNLINGGGSGSDNCSIYLVGWGERAASCIYPKGSKGGFQMDDLGEQTCYDSNQNMFQGYRSHYKWDCGLVVRDWRYVVRICNIDVSNLVSGSSAADLIKLMINATERVPNIDGAKFAFYVPRVVRQYLRHQILSKASYSLSWENFAGRKALAFDGIPVRRCDSLLTSEATISGTFASL